MRFTAVEYRAQSIINLQGGNVSVEVVVVPSESIQDPARSDVNLVQVVEGLAASQQPVSKVLQRCRPVEKLKRNANES